MVQSAELTPATPSQDDAFEPTRSDRSRWIGVNVNQCRIVVGRKSISIQSAPDTLCQPDRCSVVRINVAHGSRPAEIGKHVGSDRRHGLGREAHVLMIRRPERPGEFFLRPSAGIPGTGTADRLAAVLSADHKRACLIELPMTEENRKNPPGETFTAFPAAHKFAAPRGKEDGPGFKVGFCRIAKEKALGFDHVPAPLAAMHCTVPQLSLPGLRDQCKLCKAQMPVRRRTGRWWSVRGGRPQRI